MDLGSCPVSKTTTLTKAVSPSLKMDSWGLQFPIQPPAGLYRICMLSFQNQHKQYTPSLKNGYVGSKTENIYHLSKWILGHAQFPNLTHYWDCIIMSHLLKFHDVCHCVSVAPVRSSTDMCWCSLRLLPVLWVSLPSLPTCYWRRESGGCRRHHLMTDTIVH